jgi:hypothetical protein
MDDLFGEALFRIFGPIIVVFAIIALICYGVGGTYQWFKGPEPVVEQYQPPVEDKTLSEKAGKKTKELAKDFVKGFFSE